MLIDTFLVRTALVPGLTLWIGPAGWPGPRWTRRAAQEELAGEAAATPAVGAGALEPASQEA